MAQVTGSLRPGGRTAKTRDAVHTAVRELMASGGPSAVTMSAVAELAGVHQTTLYRRWRTAEGLVLDVAADDVASAFPVPVTGHLRADLTAYVDHLVEDLARPGSLGFFRAIIAAAETEGVEAAQELSAPRIDQFQALLDADGAPELTTVDLFELVLAPVFTWALLGGFPAGPDGDGRPDGTRLVDNVLAVRASRKRARTAG
jgi:AcrR family transcriptional regulator